MTLRIISVIVAIFLFFTPQTLGSTLAKSNLNIFDKDLLEEIKVQIQEGTFEHMKAYDALISNANRLLKEPLRSVMTKKLTASSGDKHDYLSMGPYWWPNPNTPDGMPYIRKDGIVNQDTRNLDDVAMHNMYTNVKILTLAYFYSGDKKYARRAVKQLRVWYIDPKTRMNPNMDYAQVILGHNNNFGRPYGLIDKFHVSYICDLITILKSSNVLSDRDYKSIQQWHSDFLDWMLTSENGIKEQNTKNNHAINYDSQVIAYALFSGREDIARNVCLEFMSRRIYKQVKPDGSQPHELKRTRGFHYPVFNAIMAFSASLQARAIGIDLFNQHSKDGRQVLKMFDYMAQYLGCEKQQFPYKQVTDWSDAQEYLYKALYMVNHYFPDRGYDKILEQHKQYRPKDSHIYWLTRTCY